jgi:hypothetical protein
MQRIREAVDDSKTLNLRGTFSSVYVLKELPLSRIDIAAQNSTVISTGLVAIPFD